jgi:hypothetical protein
MYRVKFFILLLLQKLILSKVSLTEFIYFIAISYRQTWMKEINGEIYDLITE